MLPRVRLEAEVPVIASDSIKSGRHSMQQLREGSNLCGIYAKPRVPA